MAEQRARTDTWSEHSRFLLPHDMHTLKTYLVEDSPVIRDSLIAALEELLPVLVVGTAEDETAATHWLAQDSNQADLVIVDIFLKTGSGLGLLRALHRAGAERHLVVLSNYASPDLQRTCLALGAAQVFDKSNDIEALLAYCEQLAQDGTDESANQRVAAGAMHGNRHATAPAATGGYWISPFFSA
jgi:DNA-binding NarL/FixJ family response regulator